MTQAGGTPALKRSIYLVRCYMTPHFSDADSNSDTESRKIHRSRRAASHILIRNGIIGAKRKSLFFLFLLNNQFAYLLPLNLSFVCLFFSLLLKFPY